VAETFRRRKVEEIRKAIMLEKKVMVQLIRKYQVVKKVATTRLCDGYLVKT
jgi:hypothetical protein